MGAAFGVGVCSTAVVTVVPDDAGADGVSLLGLTGAFERSDLSTILPT